MHCQLQPKKAKVRLYYPFICVAAKEVYPSFITGTFSFKSGCAVRVAKHLKEDRFIVLH